MASPPGTTTPLLPGGFHRFTPQADFLDNTATNTTRPLTSATITVRVIKSFEFRTMKSLVLRNLDLTATTVEGLRTMCCQEILTNPAYKPLRSAAPTLDTLKLYTRAHGAKTTNLIINLDHPEWILDDHNLRTHFRLAPDASVHTVTLAQLGIENEHELSLFNRQTYDRFVADPRVSWDVAQ